MKNQPSRCPIPTEHCHCLRTADHAVCCNCGHKTLIRPAQGSSWPQGVSSGGGGGWTGSATISSGGAGGASYFETRING